MLSKKSTGNSYRAIVLFAAVALFMCVGCERDKQASADEPEQSAATKQQQDESMADKMAEEHDGDSPKATEFAKMEPATEVTSKTVTYVEEDGTDIQGYYVRPAEAEGPLPGVIAIHEWWGLNDNIRNVSDLLAGEGYQVLAVDLYQGEVAEKPAAAKKLMEKATGEQERLEENLVAAHDFLADRNDAPKVATIGWCFGGGWSLRTALLLPDELDAAVIYYGELVTDAEKLAPLTMPVIGFFGTEDGAIPPAKVEEFEKAMNEAGNDVTIHMYEGAKHAFANPSGERYDADAAMDAWNKTTAFLAEKLSVNGKTGNSGGSDDDQEGGPQK